MRGFLAEPQAGWLNEGYWGLSTGRCQQGPTWDLGPTLLSETPPEFREAGESPVEILWDTGGGSDIDQMPVSPLLNLSDFGNVGFPMEYSELSFLNLQL